ncbi:MAG: glycosyltransferase family 4 protein [Thainema sp.]
MKVVLLANYLTDGQQSMQRFAQLMETGLTEAGHEVRVVRPEQVVGRLKPSASGLGKWLGYIDKFLVFPLSLRRAIAWADVVHICDHSNALYTRYLQNVPHLVSCHDLLAVRSALGEIPQNQTAWTGQQLQQLILKGLNRAQRAVCISQQTRQDFLRLCQLPPEAVTQVYMGLNYPYTPMAMTPARHRISQLGIPSAGRYLLHVGGNHWYKNRMGVVQMFAEVRSQLGQPDDLYLVIAGQSLPEDIHAWIDEYKLRPWVIEAHDVSNEDLRAIYTCATALLFPSFQEGFGWPIIEAQACGCPVFTSNRAPMTEVGGEAAIYIDPEDIRASAAQIVADLPDLPHRVHDSLANAHRFQPETMIAAYVEQYEQVIAEWEMVTPFDVPDDQTCDRAIAKNEASGVDSLNAIDSPNCL